MRLSRQTRAGRPKNEFCAYFWVGPIGLILQVWVQVPFLRYFSSGRPRDRPIVFPLSSPPLDVGFSTEIYSVISAIYLSIRPQPASGSIPAQHNSPSLPYQDTPSTCKYRFKSRKTQLFPVQASKTQMEIHSNQRKRGRTL